MKGFAWSANTDTLFCIFAIIEVGIPYGCSLDRFCIPIFRSSGLSLTEGRGEPRTLVDKGTPAVYGGTKVPISGCVIGVDVKTVVGAVTPISVETGVAIVAPTAVDTFKSPDGVVACKNGVCEDDCEEEELARAIDLPLLRCTTNQLDKKMKVEHFISERAHKHIVLRFWVRVLCLSHLCGCSGLDADDPQRSPHDPTMVSEPRFDEGYDRGSQSVVEKEATAVQAPCVGSLQRK